MSVDLGDMFRKLKQDVMKKTQSCNMKELLDVEDMENFNRMEDKGEKIRKWNKSTVRWKLGERRKLDNQYT